MNIQYGRISQAMRDAWHFSQNSGHFAHPPSLHDFAAGYNAAKAETPLLAPIDQTNFVPGSQQHIWTDLVSKEYAQFYFTDEITDAHGPYLTEGEAIAQLHLYIKQLG